MRLSTEVRNIVVRFAAGFPVPQGAPGPDHEERIRQWTTQLAEQIAFERPQDGFGKKRADRGRPISKDTIARPDGAMLLAWDILTASGTGRPTLVVDSDSIDITGQVFVAVTPRNHLGTAPPPAEPVPQMPAAPQPSTSLSPTVVAEILAAIQNISREIQGLRTSTEGQIADLAARLTALENKQAAGPAAPLEVVFPDYTAPLPGFGTIVLKPRR
jgi:hypothetical protein